MKYDHIEIEKKWRKKWEESGIYKFVGMPDPKKKSYILPQLPYPSGSGLHMGHSEVYTACDITSRFQRMNGKDVLQVVGWDAFGLPAENYAIKTNIHPRTNTNNAIENFREQIKSLGVSIDWDREVGSHNPDYYKWTQWFFLLMLERGLAYRKKQQVNWCDFDKTVLANEQVENGKCERCGNDVIQKEMEQWFLKITDYADRLYDDLDKVDWPRETVKRQRDWIGRSEGAHITFSVLDVEASEELSSLKVFTTRPDTIFGATFMVIAPEHKLLNDFKDQISNFTEVEEYVKKAAGKTELERQQQKEKTGIKIEGLVAINPSNGSQIPVFVGDYVLGGYGTGAIMAVPAHDQRDMEFAEKFGIDIIQVIDGEKDSEGMVYEGNMINSGEFNGISSDEAKIKIVEWLTEKGIGQKEVNYKLRDWSISRQRFWGAPIPMLYDEDKNLHPVPLTDLPVILPDDVDFKPTGRSPLIDSKEFQEGVEEKYGKGWTREMDTLDTFMCSSWYFFRYIDPKNTEAFASKEALQAWMPVDFYLGGPEHVNGHLLYSRFFTKVLFDAGYIDFDEPFTKHRHQGLIKGPDGRKMSKRWGNVINPTEVVAQYGGDTARMYLMFMGPLEQDKSWDEGGVQGVRRFLDRVNGFTNYSSISSEVVEQEINILVRKVGEDIEGLSFNTAIAEFMKFINILEDKSNNISKKHWEVFLILLAPFAPFITEELWERMGETGSIHNQLWPEYDQSVIDKMKVTMAVQFNGKTRGTIDVSKGEEQGSVNDMIQSNEKLSKYLVDKTIIRIIFVEDKIINYIVK